MLTESEFKERIRAVFINRAQDLKFSNTYIAEQVGVSRATISTIMNGHRFPGAYLFLKLCELLKVEPQISDSCRDDPELFETSGVRHLTAGNKVLVSHENETPKYMFEDTGILSTAPAPLSPEDQEALKELETLENEEEDLFF